MGIAKTTLEYISVATGNWTTAVTSDGNDAVIMLNVEQSLNSSAKADIILSNRSVDPSSSNPATAKGILADVFYEFQRIRLVHQEIGIPIFSGRIYRIRDIYDAQYGQTIRLVAFDGLKELREYPIEDAEDSLESIDTTSSNVGGYDVRKRSQVIKYMLDELDLKDKNLLTTDADHFEDSWATDSLGDKKLNLTKLNRHVAGVIQELAVADPIKYASASAVGESGYDYRVEPRFLSSAVTHKPLDSLHYFMRGSRPGKGGAYGNSAAPVLTTTSTDSLKIEYTNSDSAIDSGLKQTMMPQYEFDKPKAELYTSVVCHYTDGGTEDASAYSESAGSSEGIVTFELLKGSALSGTFVWATKGLDVEKPGVLNVPENLTYNGTVVAVAQWQNTANNYLLISNIVEASFPIVNQSVNLVGATSSSTFTFNPSTDRMKTKYGVERPVRLQRPMTSDLSIVRDEIVSRLVGRTALQIVRGKFQTVKYPIVYHDLPSNSSRSTNTITWSGTIAAKERGVRKGHIVAEINASGEYVRYAYISVVTNDESITYGTSATDTSDGTALDASNTIRLVIPLRPGDIIKTVNVQSDVNTDQVILSLGYDESPGMFAARYETVGSNNKFNNIFAEADEIRSTLSDQANRKFPGARGDRAKGELTFFFDGFVNRGSNPSDANDYRKIHWSTSAGATSGTAGTLTFSDGTKYSIACANSPTLTTAEHTIFFRTTRSKATANKSNTAFQVILTTAYTKDSEDILIGWCKASEDKRGAKAILILVPQITSRDLFASGQNGSLTEALLSKAAQEYSSGLEIVPLTSGSNRHLQVTWAACTSTEDKLTFGDGDAWSIAAKSESNYSVTSNGSSYSNITALAVNSTYFVFVDTTDTAAGGTLTLRFTTNYNHISVASDGTFYSARVLMGQIAVPANGDDGAAPRVFPFNNRSLTINAASIAASSITATHITATAIDTTKLKVTGTNGIGGLTAAGLLNISVASALNGNLSLDNTTNGTNKIAITSAQQTDFEAGGTAGAAASAASTAAAAASAAALVVANNLALGMDSSGNIKKNVVVAGLANSPSFYSFSQNTVADMVSSGGNLVLVNAQGIAGYTGVTGTYAESASDALDGLTLPASGPSFQIRTTDGRGAFGGNSILLGSNGIEFTSAAEAAGRSISWTHNPSSGDGTTWLYRENQANGGRKLVFLASGTGKTSENSAVRYVGTDIDMFGSKIYFTSSNGTLTAPGISWAPASGSTDAAGIYGSDNGTNFLHYFQGRAHANTTYMAYIATDGTYSSSYATYAKANYFRTVGSGSVGYPAHSFNSNYTSGMYYDSGVAFSAGGSIQMKLTTTEVTVHNDIYPSASGTYYLGKDSNRWAQLWSSLATNVSSDAGLKENKVAITNGLDFISRLSPITFNRIDRTEIEFGFTAQEMKQAVLDSGYTEDMAVYSEVTNARTGDVDWGIAYESLVAPLVSAIKELKERIEVLEGN